MSAGRPEKTLSGPPKTDALRLDVNTEIANGRCCSGVVNRLRGLAPLHRRSALCLAAKNVGAPWPLPSLDELAIAEAPPLPVLRTLSYSPNHLPTRDTTAAEARRVLGDLEWRAARPVESRTARRIASEREASLRITTRCEAGPTIETEVTNAEEVERGRALAAAHEPLLSALAGLLDGLDGMVPLSKLAAMADENVCELAEQAARIAREGRDWREATFRRGRQPPKDPTPDDLRQECSIWHRRRLRRQAGFARQHLAAALVTVGKGGAPYADDYSLARFRERRAATMAWAAARVLRHQDGTTTPLKDVLDRAAAGSLARLGAVLHGLDDQAEAEGLVPVMVTLTLPPVWHPNPKQGRQSWTPDRAPEAADKALRLLWSRFRARLKKSDIQTLGLRVWEPHEDGCPHIHALLYLRPGLRHRTFDPITGMVLSERTDVQEVDRHLRALCTEPVPPAKGKDGKPKRVASDLTVIDRQQSKPTTYVTKYLRKAMSAGPGDGIGQDQYDRHRATASERGWRRYAFLGVHGVQRAWQRLATVREREVASAPPQISDACAALAESRWADALVALGARATADMPRVRLLYEDRLTVYGDTARRAVAVVSDDAPGWKLPLSRGSLIEKQSASPK